MIKKIVTVMAVVCLFAGMSYGDVWQDLAKYKYGQGNAADEADQLLQKMPVAQHGAIEDSLIAVVSANDATQDGKAFACRMLQQIGSEKCIPAVAGLLSDETLSHYARLVLQRIGSPKADEALRAALDTAPEKAKIGIIGSLGERHDAKAVAAIAKLIGSNSLAIDSAAISALGKIGGESAAVRLRALNIPESLGPVLAAALLDCARSLKGADAVALYDMVLAGTTSHRLGALSGMLAADEKKAVALIVGFMKSDDAQLRNGILTIICGEKSEALTKAMAEVLGTLPDEKKPALITALGARGDKAALASITECLNSTNEPVRNAAMMAVCKIGDESTVKILLGINNGSREAIAKMSGSGVNDALVKALNDNKLKSPAIRALVARNHFAVVPALFDLLNDADGDVRRSAWDGLGSLAADEDIARMAKAAFAIKDEGELSCAVSATRNVCSRAADKDKGFDAIAAYYDGTTDSAKSAIVDLASVVGSPAALEIVNRAMKSGNKELYGKAVRSLASWSRENAAGQLLELAKSAPEEVERIVALRGYIRLAGNGPNLNPDQRGEMLKKATELAMRADDKKQIIGALNAAHNAVTVTIVNKYMDDPALRGEAEQYAANILEHICADHRDKNFPAAEVKELANKLLTSKDQGRVDRAKKALAEVAKITGA